MRKHCKRRRTVPLPPPGMRAKLDAGQLRDLALVHHANLDAIARGEADARLMWDWASSCLIWSRIAERMKIGEREMVGQLELVAAVVERFKRTGRVLFTGPEYQQAKDGVGYMDDLAAITDRPTAIEAVVWSERQTQAMKGA